MASKTVVLVQEFALSWDLEMLKLGECADWRRSRAIDPYGQREETEQGTRDFWMETSFLVVKPDQLKR